jgi:peptidoglycan/xylan/chitin deacetylase (PgdA/CDA1 family)
MRRSWRRQARLASRPGMVLALFVVGIVLVGIVAVLFVRAILPGDAASTVAARPGHVQRSQPVTTVTLTFDDAYEDQWRYGVPLLRSHHMTATFYVITSDSDGPYPCCMSWPQLRTLQGEGDDIGSHTVHHADLPKLTKAKATREVCASRQDMKKNGVDDPESFAYPFGSFNAATEKVVSGCGFTNARQGGGISSSNTTPGPPWQETVPPKDPEAVRTIAVDGNRPIQLRDLERYVVGAAAHSGGWLPITFHDVCDAYAADFIHCMSTYGAIEDIVLGQFLDWLGSAGHPGGAPAGVVVRTMRWANNTAMGPDKTAPTTTVMCDRSSCQPSYKGPATVSLPAADRGGVGVARTYFTTDGSAPSTSSRVYQVPFVVRKTTTIRVFSVDNAGNREKTKTITVRVG